MKTNERHNLTITLNDITAPQAAALMQMFTTMQHLGSMGSSRWVAFFADGDGNFRPKPEFDWDGPDVSEFAKPEKRFWRTWQQVCEDIFNDEFRIDFDILAWEMGDD